MANHFSSSSSNAGQGQVGQRVRSASHYSTMGNISGGIMRFNISAYNQQHQVGMPQKKGSRHRISSNTHSGQAIPDVKDANKSHTK